MKKILVLLFSILISFPLLAKEEILYCIETAKVGFHSKDNFSKMTEFKVDKHTIKIDFQNKSLELQSVPFWNCDIPSPGDQMYCTLDGYSFFIDIETHKFTYAKGFGYVASNNDSVNIAYGTCEKF